MHADSKHQKGKEVSLTINELLPNRSSLEKRNVELLSSYLGVISRVPFHNNELGAFAPLKDDTRYVDTNEQGERQTFTPLWIVYNTATGAISSPKHKASAGEFSYILTRYSHSTPELLGGRWRTQDFRIDLFDPTAQGQLDILSEQTLFPPTFSIERKAFSQEELAKALGDKLQVFARRIEACDPDSEHFASLSVHTAPFLPERFGTKPGDNVLVDSIITFNIISNKLQSKA